MRALWFVLCLGGCGLLDLPPEPTSDAAPAAAPKPISGGGVVGSAPQAPPKPAASAPSASPVPPAPPVPAVPPASPDKPARTVPGAGKVCGLNPVVTGPNDAAIQAFAARAGLRYPDAFVSVANTLQQTGRLPDCYLTKSAAQSKGWSPGSPVGKVAPGGAIGGDRFGNYEGLLPQGKSYVEADLDDDGGNRNAKRLVFEPAGAKSWKIWLTVDHYESFQPVPVGVK
jgi:hypothetical protein